MPTDTILLVGAGGHCQVVVDALLCAGTSEAVLEIADDDTRRWGTAVLGVPVRGALAGVLRAGGAFHVAIGNNRVRERLAAACAEAGMAARTVQHPRAVRAASAVVGDGTLLAANAIVAPGARVGAHCIVNHGAVVDHDVVVGACSHVAPLAALGGGVRLGARVLVGAGATILPGVTIGDDCVVGAGAVVLADLPPGSTFAGVPAQRLDRSPR